jgi:hypothetical protein
LLERLTLQAGGAGEKLVFFLVGAWLRGINWRSQLDDATPSIPYPVVSI